MKNPTHYLASLPERTLRAGAAVAGGLLAETANLVVPDSLRRSKLYQVTIDRFLRIVIEFIGDVPDLYSDHALSAEELAKRKVAGNVLEVASVFTFGWSPLWLLAAASDLTGGTRAYLAILVDELKGQGLLPADADIGSVESLLTTLEGTSGAAADVVDLPPLDAGALRASWNALRDNAAQLPDAAGLAATWAMLREAAEREGRSILEMSTLVAGGAVRAGWQLGNIHIFDYYRSALATIREEGLLAYLRRVGEPYARRAIQHFNPQAETYTERWLERTDEGASPADPAPAQADAPAAGNDERPVD